MKVRNYLLPVVLIVSGCATAPTCAPDTPALQESVLVKAELASREFCTGTSDGCDLTIVKTAEGWTVHADRILRTADGQKAYGIGTDQYYLYDCAGNFERVVPGL